ncbi:acyl-CoA thioesterase II [Aestuariicella sp. G3-2]|uniref:acyl-CoA thioesterase n=1 Tax=Pseudomaricurvus albidus TaxID=2842452 RepID=UPI001C0CA54D|nr:acyl-CoA thioesterase II [Aestuariicella albida]MBU3069520.1 acyl-CoA thioesterase II [Aestuariicella albida]
MNETPDQQTRSPGSLAELLDVSPRTAPTSADIHTPHEQLFFQGLKPQGGHGRVFGGLVIGQALAAASKTVTTTKAIHSLHAYFMRAGDSTLPIHYEVHNDRDGQSFSTRRVLAYQKDKPILSLTASFHTPESGLNHQYTMPDVPAPDRLLNNHQLADRHADKISDTLMKILKRKLPIETRPVDQGIPFYNKEADTQHAVWFRSRQALGDNPIIHRAALAFASDMGLLSTCMRPHKLTWHTPNLQSASLDHALWFHEPFIQADDWMLYVMDTPWSGGARGFNRGSIYDQKGKLIASAAQEGLLRPTNS